MYTAEVLMCVQHENVETCSIEIFYWLINVAKEGML